MGISSPLVDLQHQYDLLQKEYEYEKETYRQQSERTGLRKRVAQGLCWYPVTPGRSYYNSLNQLVIEIERTEDREIEHNFEYGRPVCFFTADISGKFKYLDFSATISYVQEDRMVVVLPTPSALMDIQGKSNDLGVQLYFDETSYKTMFSALSDVMRAKNNQLSHLRDVLLGQEKPGQRELFPIRFPWLNRSQEEAVNKVLGAKQVSIVHGPPGTGKTTTLVEAIYETLHRENQVIVCAQSNTAVDCISEKLVDRGINVLRIGNPTRINDKMLSFTYERRFESHPDYPELWSIRKAIRDIQSNMRKKSREERDTIRNRLSRLKFRATELEVKIDTEPPTIKCIEAEREGLGRTLMQKIAHTKPETVSLLKIQYRMHEDIMRFSSQWFYHNELESAPEVSGRGILRLDTPIVWFDTSECDFTENTREETMSRVNRQEAELLVEQLRSYIQKISKERVLEENIDFGLISPYKAQVQYIRKLIKQDAFFKPLRRLITVHTVDGFQGQERDVILISLVRANEDGKIGFLNDLRRMNVAITRARMKLMILGDASTLTRHAFYKELYNYISQRGKIITINTKQEHEL